MSASGEPERVRVAVDRGDAQPELLRAQDRAPLVAAGADEEDGLLHGRDATGRVGRLAAVALQGKRIFITGGAGFIATTLARELVDENEIVAVDNLHRDALSGTELADHPNFTLHQGDVLDADALIASSRAGATHFVHCAAIAGVETVLESPVRTMRVNVIGTYNVLEAALATLGTLERFVDFSTSEVFGTHAYNVTEGQVSTIGSVGEARWTYAVSKLAGEHMAHAYHDELGLPTVTVHPFNVFGPGQIGGGAIRAFIEAALAGRDLTVHGDGSQIRAWCYVTDMVSGVLACLERPEAVGQAFNIGNPRSSVTIYDLAQRIKRLTGCPGRDRLPAARATSTSSCGSRTWRRPASCSAGSRGSSSTTASRRRSRGTGRRRSHPSSPARRRLRGARRGRDRRRRRTRSRRRVRTARRRARPSKTAACEGATPRMRAASRNVSGAGLPRRWRPAGRRGPARMADPSFRRGAGGVSTHP